MDNLKRIGEALRGGEYSSNPQGCAEDRAILAGEYAFIMGQLEDILTRKSAIWNEMRRNVKSDTSADRAYEATEDGTNEQGLRLRAKSIEKMMSALSSLIQIAQGQAMNIH